MSQVGDDAIGKIAPRPGYDRAEATQGFPAATDVVENALTEIVKLIRVELA